MNTKNSQPRRRAALRGAARLRDAADGGVAQRKRMPFPLFLVLVTLAVTVTSTAVRAFASPAGGAWVDGGMVGVLDFLDYFVGVVTLLSLTGTVVFGLIATNQSILRPKQRVLVQSVHRGVSTAALGALVLHISVKIAFGEAAPVDAVVPLGGVGTPFAVGLGTVAAHLMVLVAVTGIIRSRFAHGRYPWLWRPLHLVAYVSWPIALAHGLTAGRPGKWYVLWGYGLCVAAVALALLVRMLGSTGRSAAELASTRKLMARDLTVSASGAAARRSAGDRDGSATEAAGAAPDARPGATLARDLPIPGAAPESQPEYRTPEYEYEAPGHQQPTLPQPAPRPVGAVLDTSEFAAQFAAAWDTGELNALLDVGQQQYAAASAAGLPYTGDRYADTARHSAAQPTTAQQPLADPGQAYPYPAGGYPTAQQPGPAPYVQPGPAPVPAPPAQYAGDPFAADPFATGTFPQQPAPGYGYGYGPGYGYPGAAPGPAAQQQPTQQQRQAPASGGPPPPSYPVDPWQAR